MPDVDQLVTMVSSTNKCMKTVKNNIIKCHHQVIKNVSGRGGFKEKIKVSQSTTL
jgi:D-arabinose 1-dehydrogenase-like Zn-dependent alcohol dehydrogenase